PTYFTVLPRVLSKSQGRKKLGKLFRREML
ncbi:MAG: hypothetical protein ACI9DJ_000461, partial [Algoriphagus sp.]